MLKKLEIPVFEKKNPSHKTEAINSMEFAHGVDALVIKALDNPVVTQVVEACVNVGIDAAFGLTLAQGIPVNRTTSPEIYAVLRHCCDALGIPVPYTIISSAISGINAACSGTDEFSFIALSNMIPLLFTIDEQRFIIGHECGHLALGHVVYHTAAVILASSAKFAPVIGPAIANTITFPLNAWYRRSEISADRAGLICCGNLDVACQTLVKLELGRAKDINVDAADYVKASKNMLNRNAIGKYGELFRTHPLLPKRIEALELFANSQMYYRLTGTEAPTRLLSDDELQRRTENSIKILD